MIKARIKLFFHCLVNFHQSWWYYGGDGLDCFGCKDCRSTFYGKACGWVYRMGWTKD